jgi:hypothetical protein
MISESRRIREIGRIKPVTSEGVILGEQFDSIHFAEWIYNKPSQDAKRALHEIGPDTVAAILIDSAVLHHVDNLTIPQTIGREDNELVVLYSSLLLSFKQDFEGDDWKIYFLSFLLACHFTEDEIKKATPILLYKLCGSDVVLIIKAQESFNRAAQRAGIQSLFITT